MAAVISDTGGAFDPGKRLLGRLVGQRPGDSSVAATTKYLMACGHTPCDAARFLARQVDEHTYMFTSECRKPRDPANAVTYDTTVPGFPEPGVPTRVRIVFGPVAYSPCFKDLCNDFELVWDGAKYGGYSIPLQSGDIPVTLEPQYVAGLFSTWHLVLHDACAPSGATVFIDASVTCFYPMTAGGNAPLGTISAACCGGAADVNTSYFVSVFGLTPSRYLARHVGDKRGRKVFAFAECCAGNLCTSGTSCCGCDAVPFAWTFSVAGITNGTLVGCPGGCLGFNGTWTLVYGVPGTPPACTWGVPTAESTGVCTPGTPWQLTCDGTDWILQTQTGGNIVYKAPVATWKCFGPNVMTLFSVGTSCATPPTTVTIAAA